MSWGTKCKKRHKVKGESYITLMIIPNPTKGAKTIKIPKKPMLALSLTIMISVLVVIGHIAKLQYQIASTNHQIQSSTYAMEAKDVTIDKLEQTNSKNFEQLKKLQTLAVQLEDRLNELEQHKEQIDSKLNGTKKTTTKQPSKPLEIKAATELVSLSSMANTYSNSEIKEEIVEKKEFEQQANELYKKLEKSAFIINAEADSYNQIDEKVDEIIPFWDAYPSILPVKNTRVTSPYGWRRNPFGYNRSEFHSGIDLSARYVPVYSTGKGKVTFAGYDSVYGYLVVIDHGYGVTTKYAHNSKLYVSKGDKVSRGDKIAKSGNSGRSTAPHVHYEVALYGETQNPLDYVYKGE